MPVTRRVVRPTAPAIKRRMRAAAEKLGLTTPAARMAYLRSAIERVKNKRPSRLEREPGSD